MKFHQSIFKMIPNTDSAKCLRSSTNELIYECEIDRLMIHNQRDELIFRLNLDGLKSDNLFIEFEVNSSSMLSNQSRSRVIKKMRFQKQATLRMIGERNNQYNFSNLAQKVLFPVSTVIEKSGHSNIEKPFVIFETPSIIELERPYEYRCLRTKENEDYVFDRSDVFNGTIRTNCDDRKKSCSQYQCKLEQFPSGNHLFHLDLTLAFIPTSLIHLDLHYHQISVEMSFRLLTNDTIFNKSYNSSSSNNSHYHLKQLFLFSKQISGKLDTRSKNKIIFGSAGFGILIVLLTTIFLIKFGFFKRSKKLQELKRMSMNPALFNIPLTDDDLNEINRLGAMDSPATSS
ncbi:UPF0472 protein [Sarcoptes scabiei]|nr:UPF0472 protein [Sarcoptes scabiei]